ncbi:hypothetical protein ABPG74_011314 [Tetrahymena malaccensis]
MNNQINYNKNQQKSFLEYIKAKIFEYRDRQLQKIQNEITLFCEDILMEIDQSYFVDCEPIPQVNEYTQNSFALNLYAKDLSEQFYMLNDNNYVKVSHMENINLQQYVMQDQSSGIQEEQRYIDQPLSNVLQCDNSHIPSCSTSIQDDQQQADNIQCYSKQQQQQKKKRIQKQIQTKIQYRETSKKVNENAGEEKKKTTSLSQVLSFKNQIKGFISKYFKRLAKQKREIVLDTDIPLKMFEKMSGSRKKKDLFLILNKFFSSKEPTQGEYEHYLEHNSFQYEYDQIKPNHNLLQDDQFLEQQQEIKIKEREFELMIELRDYFEDPQFDGYEGFKNFVTYYNHITTFFRKDIYKYLISQSYVHDLCVKKAEKMDQIYIKNVILNLVLNPKVLL